MRDTEASATAKVIAAATLLLAADPKSADQVAPAATKLCEAFLSASLSGRLLARSVRSPVTRKMWKWIESITLPGIVSHYWHRKRWIEKRCRAALDGGFERLVIIGAGFDSLGIRMAEEFDRLEVTEIDHPATQEEKRRGFTRARDHLPENFNLVALDLSAGSLPASLSGETKPTLFVIEGLLMYLPLAAIIDLFRHLKELHYSRTRVIFSFMTRWPDGRSGFSPRSRLIDLWLSWRGEPFTWGLGPEAVEEFVSDFGFRLIEQASAPELSAGCPEAGRLDGENLAVCETSR